MINANIDPEKYYSGYAVVKLKVLPWTTRRTFYKKLHNEEYEKILKPIYEKKEIMTRVFIRGENIIKFIEFLNEKNIYGK